MPKLITEKHLGSNQERARNYVKAYILYPSGFFGLACMVAGTASLGYQLVATDTYTWTTFAESFGLLLLGGVRPAFELQAKRSRGGMHGSREASFEGGGGRRAGDSDADQLSRLTLRISRRDGDVVNRFDGQCLDGACARHCSLSDALGRLLLVEAILLANRVEGGSVK